MSFYPIDMNTYLGQTVNYARYLSASVGYWQLPEEFSNNKSLEEILNTEKLKLGISEPTLDNILSEVRGTLLEFKEAKLQDRYANDAFEAYKDIWRSYSEVNKIGQLFDDEHERESYIFRNYHLIKETNGIDKTNTEIAQKILNLIKKRDELKPLNDWFWNVLDKLRYCFENFVPELFEREKELFYKLPYVNDQFELYYKTVITADPPPTTQMDPIDQSSLGIKLKWSCQPAIAGHIISELIRAGYLEPTLTKGELSLNKLADICSQLFEFRDHKSTKDQWRNVVDPRRNQLTDVTRQKLKLPDLDTLK